MTNLFKQKFMKVPNLSIGHAFREVGRNAFVDWILILLVNFLVILILMSFGAYLYWQISTGKFVSTEPASEQKGIVFNEKDLKMVINKFENRENNTAQIKRGYRGPGDPSL